MSEEAAFLSALKANPADDTARLVYADWLDEHDQPHKAEYLRAVVEVARAPEDATASARILAVARDIEVEWRIDVGSRFALILDGYTDKVRAIRWLRELTGDGLGEAKEASEDLPQVVYDAAPWEVVCDALARRSEPSAIMLQIVPLAGLPVDDGIRYELFVRCLVYGADNDSSERLRAETEALQVLAKVLAAVPSDLQPETNNDLVFLSDLTRAEARTQRDRLLKLTPPLKEQSGWGIWLQRRRLP